MGGRCLNFPRAGRHGRKETRNAEKYMVLRAEQSQAQGADSSPAAQLVALLAEVTLAGCLFQQQPALVQLQLQAVHLDLQAVQAGSTGRQAVQTGIARQAVQTERISCSWFVQPHQQQHRA